MRTFNCAGTGEDILKRTHIAQEITPNIDNLDYMKFNFITKGKVN